MNRKPEPVNVSNGLRPESTVAPPRLRPEVARNRLRGGEPVFRAGCVGRLPFMFDMLAVAQQLAAGGVAREQAEPFERSGPGSALR